MKRLKRDEREQLDQALLSNDILRAENRRLDDRRKHVADLLAKCRYNNTMLTDELGKVREELQRMSEALSA